MHSDHSSFSVFNQAQTIPFQPSGPSITAGRTFRYASTKNHHQRDLQGKLPPLSNNEPSSQSQATQNLQQHLTQQQNLPEMMNKGASPSVKDFPKAEIGVISAPNVSGKVSAQVQNASGICAGEMAREMKRVMMPSSNDASKPAAMNNTFCANNSNSCIVKQEVFDNLNLAEFDQEFLGDLLDGVDW